MHKLMHLLAIGLLFTVATAAPAQELPDDVRRAIAATQRGDFETAYAVWVQRAQQGDDKAAIEAGLAHHMGRGRPVDHAQALTWYLSALEKNGDAWNNIGVIFRDGLGVPQNRRIAHLMFLTVHMTGFGNEATVMRANRNLRREIAELPLAERQASLCYTMGYLQAYVRSRGELKEVPEHLRASPERKRIGELGWWLPGEVGRLDCPAGT
jgi:uncharacterized protein